MLPRQIQSLALESLKAHCGQEIQILQTDTVGGGCIHNSHKITTNKGFFFLKWNESPFSFDQMDAEQKGLKTLQITGCIKTPEVIYFGRNGNFGLLILEWIEQGLKQHSFWDHFAKQLATLHQNHASKFGLEHDNFIGSLPQINTATLTWHDFFVEHRILPMMKSALEKGLIDQTIVRKTENFCIQAEQLFPDEPPALVHGDLWSGNYLVNTDEEAVIFDPAVHYANREVELAFTMLFGGFDKAFYDAYHSYHPLSPGFEKRKDYYNLYPMYVHLNMFGIGYLSSVKQILSKF